MSCVNGQQKTDRRYIKTRVEKSRRDRINKSLDTLRKLILCPDEIPKHQKLEKAEILEMTVAYIIQINTLFRRIQYRQQVTPIDYMQPHLYAIDQINEEHYVNDEHKSTFSCKKRKSTDCDNLRYYHERKYCCRNDDNSLNYCVKRRRTCTSEDNVWRPWLIN